MRLAVYNSDSELSLVSFIPLLIFNFFFATDAAIA